MNSTLHINLIVAIDRKNGIAKNRKIPWRIKADMDFFKLTTTGDNNNCVIMGSKTYSSIPSKFRPLINRHNIVISQKTFNNDNIKETIIPNNSSIGIEVASSLENAIERAKNGNFESIFIMGGKQVYEEMLSKYLYLCKNIYVSIIDGDYDCDQFIEYDILGIAKDGDYVSHIQKFEDFNLYHFVKNG